MLSSALCTALPKKTTKNFVTPTCSSAPHAVSPSAHREFTHSRAQPNAKLASGPHLPSRYLRARALGGSPFTDAPLQNPANRKRSHAARSRGPGYLLVWPLAGWRLAVDETGVLDSTFFLADSPPRLLSYSPRACSCHPLLFSVHPSSSSLSLSLSLSRRPGRRRAPSAAPGEEPAIAAAGEFPFPAPL